MFINRTLAYIRKYHTKVDEMDIEKYFLFSSHLTSTASGLARFSQFNKIYLS
jgi:hypothetical protein